MAHFQSKSAWLAARRAPRRFGAVPFGGSLSVSEIRATAPGKDPNYLVIASPGDSAYVNKPMTVYAGNGFVEYSRQFPAGAVKCTSDVFGGPSSFLLPCYVKKSDVDFAPLPGNATHVADAGDGTPGSGQGFHIDGPGTLYYGSDSAGYVQLRLTQAGSFMCDNSNFGPDPAYGYQKRCMFVPDVAATAGAPITYEDTQAAQLESMQRSEAAAQAQRDAEAAQQQVLAAQQSSDYAAQQAQIAQNAQAQAAAALAAAEAYRSIQDTAHKQAADYAAQLAAIAAASAAPEDKLAAANAVATQAAAEQAVAQATNDKAQAQAAYDAANAATQVELRKQEEANAQLSAAQDAAAQQAANAAAGGAASPLSTYNILLYGGIAALAAYLLLGEG